MHSSRRLHRLGAFVALLGIGLAPAACTTSVEDDVGETSEAAFTVSNGDRFVVSASAEEIVLRKKVGSAAFPFDEDSLLGKAVLIHPVASRAETGVYVRATSVTSEGDRYVVKGAPLTLREMEELTEDDVVRIYIDPRRGRGASSPTGLGPESLVHTGQLQPLAMNGVAFEGFETTSTSWNLSQPTFLKTGVKLKHTVETADFSPEVLFAWSRTEGLELGFRGKLAWKSSLEVSANAAGEIFRSRTVETPRFTGVFMIGVAPVPVSLFAQATVVCSAGYAGILKTTITLDANAELAGSLRVQPSLETSPRDWVKEGPWPAIADGSASVTVGVAPTFGTTLTCTVPRTEVKALVGGVAGPYLAITPTIGANEKGAVLEARVKAGVGAGMLGLGTSVEMNLYTWKP